MGKGFKQIGGMRLALPSRGAATAEENFLRLLPLRGLTIYDVGAFQGILTLFFADRAGPDGQVVAFEPHPDNYRRALTHLELNRVANVTVRNVAVGETTGSLDLLGPPGGGGTASAVEEVQRKYLSLGEDLESVQVPVVSIDEEARSGAFPDPDFVKIDVEGMELPVLHGLSETIARCKPKLFVEMHGVDFEAKRANAAAVVEFLIDRGYSPHHVENLSDVRERNPVMEEIAH